MLQKVEVSLRQLVEQPSVSPERLEWVTRQVNLFFGSFRKADADDPETFTAGCMRLFTAYPPECVQFIVDPVTGLPGQSEWLPSLKKVKEALDLRAEQIANAQARIAREQQQLKARREFEALQKRKPTFEELKAKYGENWGLQTANPESEEVKAKRRELQQEANRAAFEAECEAAGWPKDSTVSPSLAKIINASRGPE